MICIFTATTKTTGVKLACIRARVEKCHVGKKESAYPYDSLLD